MNTGHDTSGSTAHGDDVSGLFICHPENIRSRERFVVTVKAGSNG